MSKVSVKQAIAVIREAMKKHTLTTNPGWYAFDRDLTHLEMREAQMEETRTAATINHVLRAEGYTEDVE